MVKEELTITSQPFGLCSHSQYFPELVAKVILFEVEQITQSVSYIYRSQQYRSLISFQINSIIPPHILTNYICGYHTHISGIEPKYHTQYFIYRVLQEAHGLSVEKSFRSHFLTCI